MDSPTRIVTFRSPGRAWLCLAAALALPALLSAAPKKNPTSKFYVADVDGDAEIDTGDRVDDLNKKSVYNAEGTVIETKPNAANAMVFSNGTGIFFDEDTRLEVKQFEQEPFVPNRTDMDIEPSISQTSAYIPRGTVGLCASKLVAGSKMTYQTPNGAVNIRSGKVVIQANNGVTTVSMLQGESTITSGNVNMGGHTLQDGQQAVIRTGINGAPPKITIQPIPDDQHAALEGKVTMACTAKKTVYFAAVAGKATTTVDHGARGYSEPARSRLHAPRADHRIRRRHREHQQFEQHPLFQHRVPDDRGRSGRPHQPTGPIHRQPRQPDLQSRPLMRPRGLPAAPPRPRP